MIEANVLVVGAGAIGGVTAAKMTGEVDRVAVLDANEEHVERMSGEGLLVDDLGEERRVRLEAHADPTRLEGPFDFALITLKAPHLESALGPLLDLGLVNTFVSLGNGLVQERVAGIVGEGRLIWGTVEWGATNLGPGHLARTTRGPFIIGEPDGSVRDRTRMLAGALGVVDEARVTENIRGQVWSKLLVNSAFSGLGAISGLLYREVVGTPTATRRPWPSGARGTSGWRKTWSSRTCSASRRDLSSCAAPGTGSGRTRRSMSPCGRPGPPRPRCSRTSSGGSRPR
jgi:2-dehydropantoate 2-reductase